MHLSPRSTCLRLALLALLPAAALGASGSQTVTHTAADLQTVNANMAGNFVLDADIDLSGISNFTPIGLSSDSSATADPTPFTGTFDGAGHAIAGLTQTSGRKYSGLFGLIGPGGAVTNLSLRDARIASSYGGGMASTGNPNPGTIGILAGENDRGSIDHVVVSGTIAITGAGSAFGGFVGVNTGAISTASIRISVQGGTGINVVGGLLGSNSGSIVSSYWDVTRSGVKNAIGSGTTTGGTSWTSAPVALPAGFDPAYWGLAAGVDGGYPCLLLQAACAAGGSLSDSDRILNYAEAIWPQFVGMASQASATWQGYYSRYYTATGLYLGTRDGEFYAGFFGAVTGQSVVDLGRASLWLAMAKAAGF